MTWTRIPPSKPHAPDANDPSPYPQLEYSYTDAACGYGPTTTGAVMSDVREVHDAVASDLQRRRQLVDLPKHELINMIINLEASGRRTQAAIRDARERINDAHQDQA